MNPVIERHNRATYEKVVSTNEGNIQSYPQSSLKVIPARIQNTAINYVSTISDSDHQKQLYKKQIELAIRLSKYDDKIIALREFQVRTFNFLNILERNMFDYPREAVIASKEFTKRVNVVA